MIEGDENVRPQCLVFIDCVQKYSICCALPALSVCVLHTAVSLQLQNIPNDCNV